MNRDQILRRALELQPGERWEIGQQTMQAAFGRKGFLTAHRSPEDDFLDQMPGADYGAWTCSQELISGAYRIVRHPEQAQRVREDSDRR